MAYLFRGVDDGRYAVRTLRLLKPVAELDGSGNVVSRFVYATSVNVPDYLIKNGQTYRILTDHRGSPRLVINTATGVVQQHVGRVSGA